MKGEAAETEEKQQYSLLEERRIKRVNDMRKTRVGRRRGGNKKTTDDSNKNKYSTKHKTGVH